MERASVLVNVLSILPRMKATGRVVLGDNLTVLRSLPDASIRLVYIDPPFNTRAVRKRERIRVERDEAGDRTGFGGRRYRTRKEAGAAYSDRFDDYLTFLEERLVEVRRVLTEDGSLYFHIDYREAHRCKLLLDDIFGERSFLNEIIWAYDFGGRPRRRWAPKHDTIFWYCKTPGLQIFNRDEIDRIPYLAPGLVGEEKARRGKLPTDVWWNTIVPTSGKERTRYPTQKPLAIARRIVAASSYPGDLVADFFAGSGTTGVAAHELGRRFLLVDNNPEAIAVMKDRFAEIPGVEWEDLSAPPV